MKKIIKSSALLLAMVMILSVLVAGCGKKDDAKKTFTIGLDPSFKPYGYKDEKTGELVGFDIDLAKEVAKRNGWEFKAQPIDWNSKDMELKSGTIDCVWNGFTINGREKLYTWTEAYVDSSQVVVVKKDSGIKTLSDLKNKVVVTQEGSSAKDVLTDTKDQKMVDLVATFKELQYVPMYSTAFLSLKAGSVDAVAGDVGVADSYLKNNEDFVILEEQLAVEQYGVGFKLGNTELRDQVQKTLYEMMDDGTFLKIAEKWELQDNIIVKK